MDNPDERRDFFVSYTQADRAWAEWLAWELEAAGYTTMLQAWDMPAGTAFVHAMDRAVQDSRHTVLVLSPAYLRSEMAEAEWRPAFKADPTGQARRLLPVRVEACEPAGLLADRVWIDLVGLEEVAARTRLLGEVAAALRGHARPTTRPRFPRAPVPTAAAERPRFPTALPPVWNVPFRRNPTFTGRDQLLGDLAGGAAAGTHVLHGGGGVGKTTLAVEYAYRYRARFDTVWWVRAEQPATLVGDYADLAGAVGLEAAGQADQQLTVLAVRRWLEDHDRWLLILDNAEDPQVPSGLRTPLTRLVDLLPQLVHGQVLVTSRDASWEDHADLAELEVFTPLEGVAFLLARSGSRDEQAAAIVGERLGWLPLALEQAGAYVRQTRIPLATYLERLQQAPSLAVVRGQPRDRHPADTIATTWQVSVERVRPTPGAAELLEVCAFLGPEEIPRELFSQALHPPPDALAMLADSPFAFDEAVAGLRRFGLVKADEQALTVHRLVQAVIRDGLDPESRQRRLQTGERLVLAGFPDPRDVAAWPAAARLLPHALAVTDHADAQDANSALTGRLLNRTAVYLRWRAQFTQARALLERALAINTAVLGPEHPEVLTSLDHLGDTLYALRELPAARQAHERALAIRVDQLGPEHPDTARSLDLLGNVLRGLGEWPAARTHYDRALTIRRSQLGPEHPDTAQSLEHLGLAVQGLGELASARQLQEQALAIREARLGAEDPATAQSLNSLANVVAEQGDLPAARALHERALAIRETQLGSDHPHTAWSLNNLGTLLVDQGDLTQGRALLERALAIREARLGPAHPETAWNLHNLAKVLHQQGDLPAARNLHQRALAIRETRLGPDHPDTGHSLHNLANVLADQGDLPAARNLLQRALAIREAHLGPDHPRTIRSRRSLAAIVAQLKPQS